MIDKHLNEAEIQQYILQILTCDVNITEHIQRCTNCKIKAEQYSLLFEGIKQQEKPVFDFNLADLVIKGLPKAEQKIYNEKSFWYFIIFPIIFFVCIVFYPFRIILLNLFLQTTAVITGLIITTVISLLTILCIDVYKKYQTQMKALNFY